MSELKKYGKFSLFFSLIVIANLLFFTHLQDYRMVSKPMIMASLIAFYIGVAPRQSNVFILAMIFALLGDIFLMFNGEDFFLIGLGCFLVMQVLYTVVFLKDRSHETKRNAIYIICILVPVILIISYLWQGLGTMKVPVSVYAAAITLMVISAVIRLRKTPWYLPVVMGVFLFMVSDAMIAFSKFVSAVAGTDYIIMSTYMAAQYLIVRGVIESSEA